MGRCTGTVAGFAKAHVSDILNFMNTRGATGASFNGIGSITGSIDNRSRKDISSNTCSRLLEYQAVCRSKIASRARCLFTSF